MAVYQNENEPDGQLPLDAGSEMKYLRQRWKKRSKEVLQGSCVDICSVQARLQ